MTDMHKGMQGLDESGGVGVAFHMAMPVILTDATARILRANDAFCRMTGYGPDELRGQTPALLKSGRHGAAFYRAMWTALFETGFWRGEVWNRRKSGEIYREDLTISAVYGADGAITHFVGMVVELDRKLSRVSRSVHLAMEQDIGLRPTAEEPYLQSELHAIVAADRSVFAFIEEAALDGLMYWDLEIPGQEWMSDRFWSLFGYAAEADGGSRPKWEALVHPDDLPAAREDLRRHLADPSQRLDTVLRFRHADGSTVWVRWRGRAIRDAKGQPIRLLGAHTDVSDLMRAQEALAAAQGREAGILAALGEGVYGVDPSGHCTFANPAAQQMLGLSADALVGANQHALFHGRRRDGTLYPAEDCPITHVLRTGRRWEGEEWFLRQDGSGFPVWLVATPMEAAGRVVGAVVAFQDLSQRKAAEEALLLEKRRLESVIEGTGAGTWEWNVRTGEVVFNARWAAIIGETLDDLVPLSIQTWLDRVHPDDRVTSEERLREHFAGRAVAYDCEARMRHRDGSWVWVQDRGRVVKWTDDGQPLWMAGTHIDITAQVRARKALEEREERYRLAQSATRVGLWDWDLTADRIVWDEASWALLGRADAGEVLTYATWRALIHPEDLGSATAELDRQLTQGGDFTLDFRYRTSTNDFLWVQGRGRVVARGADGQPTRMVGTHTPIHDAKLAQLKADEFGQRLGLLAHHVPGVLYQYRLHPDGRACFPYASDRLVDIYGCDPRDVIDDAGPVFAVLHPDDMPQVRASISESARTLRPWRAEYRVLHPQRGLIWVEGHATPEGLPDGSIQWHGYIADITERRVLHDRLVAREQRLSDLFDAIPDPVVMIEAETGRATHFNMAACVQLGYTVDEFAALTISDYEVLESAAETRARVDAIMTKGGDTFETRHRRKDGQVIDVLVTVRRMDLDGRPKMLGVFRDISEDKRLRASLQDAHDRLASYIRLAPLGVFVADRQGRYREVNPEACRQTGYPEDDLLAMTVGDLVWPDDHERGRGHLERVLRNGVAVGDVRFRRKEGGVLLGHRSGRIAAGRPGHRLRRGYNG